jgi:hypothetical protein
MSQGIMDSFTHKHDTLLMEMIGNKFIVTSVQVVRADVTWVSESVVDTLQDASKIFAEQKQCILNHGRCIGMKNYIR